PARDPERRRLDERQRPQPVGVPDCGEERDHAAVGVADQVCPRLDQLLEPGSLVLVVDALDARAGRKAPPGRGHELEAVGEGALRAPGGVAVDDAAVDEEDAGTSHPGDRTNSRGIADSDARHVLQATRGELLLSPRTCRNALRPRSIPPGPE